jgi:inner membrane protein
MHRTGHIGTALLLYAPVAYGLIHNGQIALAALGLVGMLVIEPIPDRDMEIPWLTHRGGSHTLLCAALVGLCLGGIVLVGGRHLRALVVTQLAGTPLSGTASKIAAMDVQAFAVFAFAIAGFAIVSHLLGDVLTPMGIRPFWPLSSRKLSLGVWTASNRIANPALLVLGIAALAGAAWFGVDMTVPVDGTVKQLLREVLHNS